MNITGYKKHKKEMQYRLKIAQKEKKEELIDNIKKHILSCNSKIKELKQANEGKKKRRFKKIKK